MQQAKQFSASVGVTGLILTKLDGTAKGGIVLATPGELNIPVKFIGTGERTTTCSRSTVHHSSRHCFAAMTPPQNRGPPDHIANQESPAGGHPADRPRWSRN